MLNNNLGTVPNCFAIVIVDTYIINAWILTRVEILT